MMTNANDANLDSDIREDRLGLDRLFDAWERAADETRKSINDADFNEIYHKLATLHGEISCETPRTWHGLRRLLRLIHRIETERETRLNSWWDDFPASALTAAVMRGLDRLYDVPRRAEDSAQLRYDDEQKARGGADADIRH